MSYRFSRKRLRKSDGEESVLRELRAFLDEAEPKLVAFLVHLWGYQGRAITYKALREAILRGELEPLDGMASDWHSLPVTGTVPSGSLCGRLLCGASRWRRGEGRLQIAVPALPGTAFPLPECVCFASRIRLDSGAFWVFSFDASGRPVF